MVLNVDWFQSRQQSPLQINWGDYGTERLLTSVCREAKRRYVEEPTERRSRQDGCPFVTLREWPRSEQTLHARDETKELSVFLQKLLCGALNPENLNFPDPPRCGLSKCYRTEWLFWRCFFHDVSLREEVSFSLRVTWRCNYTFLSLWDWNRKIYSGFVPLRGSETVTFLFFLVS